jgi:hypothetical protein
MAALAPTTVSAVAATALMGRVPLVQLATRRAALSAASQERFAMTVFADNPVHRLASSAPAAMRAAAELATSLLLAL